MICGRAHEVGVGSGGGEGCPYKVINPQRKTLAINEYTNLPILIAAANVLVKV